MKQNSFRRVVFTMERTLRYGPYGHYYISAHYKGKDIKVMDTDGDVYDYLDDDSNKKKYNEARKHCYNRIREQYENL